MAGDAVLAEIDLVQSLPVETIENSTSTSLRSNRLSTTLPPILASGSAFERVRFQIETS